MGKLKASFVDHTSELFRTAFWGNSAGFVPSFNFVRLCLDAKFERFKMTSK
jgi:hypothetical protein